MSRSPADFHLRRETVQHGTRFYGDCTYRGILFEYTLVPQKDGTHRGRITVLSPIKGEPMAFLVKHPYAKKDKDKIATVKYREIGTKYESKAKIERYIRGKAATIFSDNALTFNKLLKKTVKPDTVSADLAGYLYGVEFIKYRFAKSNKEETMQKKLRRLTELLAALPPSPMAGIKTGEIAVRLEKHPVLDFTLLSDFWDYCILQHYCVGGNPVHIPKSEGASDTEKQNRLKKLTRVPERNLQQMNRALRDSHGGSDCGVALLESGISAKVACDLRWSDIKWPTDDPAYALVTLDRPSVMCAIHNYTRPLLPDAALVLYYRREELLKKYSMEAFLELRVVSFKRDPTKAMQPSALIQEAKQQLVKAGITENKLLQAKECRSDPISARILAETYKDLLIKVCGIEEGSGTYQFLLGQAIHNDVSSSNYLSFTSPEGSLRLYKYLRATAPPVQYESLLTLEETAKRTRYHVLPESSDRCAGMITDVILQPHEALKIRADSGLTGRVTAAAVTD